MTANTAFDLEGNPVTVEKTTTLSVRIQGLGRVDVVAAEDASTTQVLVACLKAHGAKADAVDNLFPVLNGEDVEDPDQTSVKAGDRVTAAAKAENG